MRTMKNIFIILAILSTFTAFGKNSKKLLLIEDFEKMNLGDTVSPTGNEKEEMIVGSAIQGARWIFNAGGGKADKWRISVVGPGYNSEKSLRLEWNVKHGGWLSNTLYFEDALVIKKPRCLTFMVQSQYMTEVEVLIGIQSKKGKEVSFSRCVSISKSKRWRKITVMLRQMGVPSWYIKKYGKPQIRKFPALCRITSISINPGWKSSGDIKIDNIKIK